MIRLAKLPKPSVLTKQENAWTEKYIRSLKDGNVPDRVRYRYRHAEIKRTIRQETSDKCAYCESKITHSQPGDVEHIHPVSKFPELIVSWDNLTLVCRTCNVEKGSYFSDDEPVVHPYKNDPEDHIVFVGQLAYNTPGDNLGYRTIHLLDLNRSGLIERRFEHLQHLKVLVDRWASQSPGTTKDLLRREVLSWAEKDKAYASLARCFLRTHAQLPC